MIPRDLASGPPGPPRRGYRHDGPGSPAPGVGRPLPVQADTVNKHTGVDGGTTKEFPVEIPFSNIYGWVRRAVRGLGPGRWSDFPLSPAAGGRGRPPAIDHPGDCRAVPLFGLPPSAPRERLGSFLPVQRREIRRGTKSRRKVRPVPIRTRGFPACKVVSCAAPPPPSMPYVFPSVGRPSAPYFRPHFYASYLPTS